MNNYKNTLQFKGQNKAWQPRQGNLDVGNYTPPSATDFLAKTDLDGDTIMTPTHMTGNKGARDGGCGNQSRSGRSPGTGPRAKWVLRAEIDTRREKGLCFWCGASRHRVDLCPCRPAVKPSLGTSVDVYCTHTLPTLADDNKEASVSNGDTAGKA